MKKMMLIALAALALGFGAFAGKAIADSKSQAACCAPDAACCAAGAECCN